MTAVGKVDLESSIRLFTGSLDLAAHEGARKILVDGRLLSGKLSALDRYELGTKATEHLAKLGTHPTIAFVGYAPLFEGLAILVAQNRGADVRLFRSLPQALKWLTRER